MEESDGCQVNPFERNNFSVMIQKLDKKALALRLFGKDSEDPVEEKGEAQFKDAVDDIVDE